MKRLLVVHCVLVMASASAFAQAAQSDSHSNVFLGGDKQKKEKSPTSRSVRGTVTDGFGKPLANALVTLSNEDTHGRLTYFTKKDGQYYFDGLSFTTDYKLIAEYKDGRSVVKTLSQYDHSPRIVRILEISPTAEAKPPAAAANH